MFVQSELELEMLLGMVETRGLVPVVSAIEDPMAWKRTGALHILCWHISLWRCGFWGRLKQVHQS